MNRGSRRLPVFGDDHDRIRFLNQLGDAAAKTGLEVHGYALMGNHFHLLTHGCVEILGATMKRLGSSYTQVHNKKYGLDGALFRGRYRSKPVLDETYLRNALRYVHRNPLTANPNLARRDAFRWTSHLAYLGEPSDHTWLMSDRLLEEFGGDRHSYRKFVEGEDEQTSRDYELSTWVPPVRVVTPDEVEAALGVGSAPERKLLSQGGRGVRNRLRLACVYLCSRATALSSSELARRYGFRSDSGVRTASLRARDLLASDHDFAALVHAAASRVRIELPDPA
jgi:REP element-mobilizing transposase RayT